VELEPMPLLRLEPALDGGAFGALGRSHESSLRAHGRGRGKTL
jgi:hypothetical protein